MYRILKKSKNELNTLILNTASKKGLNAAIVEKDFWVCITLDYLFHHSKRKEKIAFKGGTCLSKVYHQIERFSEDIDLIMDWRILGYGINEPWQDRSNAQQLKFIESSKERLFTFLKDDFLPSFKEGMNQLLGFEINAYIDPNDLETIIFAYPSTYSDSSILKYIKLEAGVLSTWMPLERHSIKCFLAEEYANIFSYKDIYLVATTVERIFWEKVTILHQEAFRPVGSKVPHRYSRHYYDIYCMVKNGVAEKAMKNPKLLEEVALFKMKFYPRKWARYDLAKFGTIKLLPPEHSVNELKNDYNDMKSMIYGMYPSFDEIIEIIRELEEEINHKFKN